MDLFCKPYARGSLSQPSESQTTLLPPASFVIPETVCSSASETGRLPRRFAALEALRQQIRSRSCKTCVGCTSMASNAVFPRASDRRRRRVCSSSLRTFSCKAIREDMSRSWRFACHSYMSALEFFSFASDIHQHSPICLPKTFCQLWQYCLFDCVTLSLLRNMDRACQTMCW